ncbi:MAG: VPLPA-CTERM sorting domain-containing protein [Gammaproteobacteria bacterium]
MRTVIALFFFGVSFAAHSATLTWTFNDVVFGDGTTLSGSFDYDADSNIMSNVSVITQANAVLGVEFDWLEPTTHTAGIISGIEIVLTPTPYYNSVVCADTTCSVDLGIFIENPLSNAGGTVNISNGSELSQSSAPHWGTRARGWSGGTLTAVPVPAAVWLFGSALTGLGWMRRKQTA